MDSFTCRPAVLFPVHYFSSSPVDDMIVPGDMVIDCRFVHLSERAFLSALVWTSLLAIFVFFLRSSSLLPRLLPVSPMYSHNCDMVSFTHKLQCLLHYICLLNVPESVWVSWRASWLYLINTTTTTLCLKKNVLTLKRYSSKLQGAILVKFGRNIQNTLE